MVVRTLLILGLLAQSASVQTPKVDLQKQHTISGKAKRGYLGQVETDNNGHYFLTYVTKSTKRQFKTETYEFDGDFNFVNSEVFEDDVERVKSKFKWLKGGDEGAEYQLLTVENNLTAQVVLKKGRFVKKYNYNSGYTWWDFVTDEKTKPKDPEGRRLNLVAYQTSEPQETISYGSWSWLSTGGTKDFSEISGDITLVCSVIPKISDAFKGKEIPPTYAVLKISVEDMSIISEETFTFEHPQIVKFSKNRLENGNIGVLFAPVGGDKKRQDPNPLNFTFVEVNPESTSIERRISFDAPFTQWAVDDMNANGENVYFYGPGNSKKNSKHVNIAGLSKKYKEFGIVKITGNQIGFNKTYGLDAFDDVLTGPQNQKKHPSYQGKRFIVGQLREMPNGDFLIDGQNFKSKGDKGNEYLDLFAFHFGSDGALKAQYGIAKSEKNKYSKQVPTELLYMDAPNGKGTYVILLEVAGARSSKNEVDVMMYPRMCMIDNETANMSEIVNVGYGKKDRYYLENNFPILPAGGNSLVFFSSDKKGKKLNFTRVNL